MLVTNGAFDVSLERLDAASWMWKVYDKKRKKAWTGKTNGGYRTATHDIQESINFHLMKVAEEKGLI